MKPSLPPCAHPQGLPCCPPPLWPAQAKQCTVCTMGPANNEDDSKRGQLCFTRPGKTDKVNKVTKPLLLPGNHMQARSGETEGLTLVCYYNQSICYPVISAEERFVFQDTVLQSVEWIRRWAPHFKAAVDKEEYWHILQRTCLLCIWRCFHCERHSIIKCCLHCICTALQYSIHSVKSHLEQDGK